jgi:phosphoglycerol transferase MdoB-like AlkP superfamily enzyme
MDTTQDKKNLVRLLKLPVTYMVVFFIYLELVFHILRMGFVSSNLLLKLLFSAFYGILTGALLSLIPKRVSEILSIVITVLVTVYYIAQLIYSGVFSTYLSISGTFTVANQALDFTDVIASELCGEWWKLILLLLPLVWRIVFGRKWLDFGKHTPYQYIVYTGMAIVVCSLIHVKFAADSDDIYSPYNVYSHYTSVDMSTEKLGVAETFVLDTVSGIRNKAGYSEKVSFIEEATETAQLEENGTLSYVKSGVAAVAKYGQQLTLEAKGIDTSPNVLDIDFDELISETADENVNSLSTYISGLTPTNKNEYTGMFEGYNVIFIVAEGFSGYVVDKDRTPTLYNMVHNGFYFKNYYTPLWYGSTLGGEYADLTGLMPKNGGYLSMQKAGANGNDMYFTLSRQLERQGYAVNGYHANDYTYYDRQISHPNLGLNWVGVGNGYEPEYSESGTQLWPQSDLRLVENTFDLYADDEPFYTYYLTVSGHVMYNFGGNAMAARHKDLVEDLDYTETTKAYIACQYELELALEELNSQLEECGLADNTLIVLTADHIPYDDTEVIDELAGEELDATFERYKNSLIIWSASMEESVTVDKPCSSLDILPTVSNLLGLSYDSRMMVGQDILSDSEGLVIFNDRSFITDKCRYNASGGQAVSEDGSSIDEAYVENMKAQISNKFNMAQSICDYDYYRYIDDYINENNGSE